MNKKLLIAIVGLICLGGLTYFNEFSIKNDTESIQSQLTKFLNRVSSAPAVQPTVLEIVRLDRSNTYLALFQTESQQIGSAILKAGLNNRLKISNAGYGTNQIRYQTVPTSKGVYGVIVGENPNLLIDHVKLTLPDEDLTYTIDISRDERVVKYQPYPGKFNRKTYAELAFFDKAGEVVSPQR